MCRWTPVPIYSGSALFRWLDKQFNACSTRCVGSGSGRFYHEIHRVQVLISSLGRWLAVRAAVTGHVVRSNRPSSLLGMKRVLEALS
jgi:hypothetical protein